MSHEGIRIVSAGQAAQELAPEARMPAEAVTPARVRVLKTEGTGVEIDWKDGHRSQWTFAWLREACPCATCHEARDVDGRKPGIPKPQPTTLLPIFKPAMRPLEVNAVGKYAIRFKWNDGHESGIYSWEYLRRLPENAEATLAAAAPVG